MIEAILDIGLFGFLIWSVWTHEKRLDQLEVDVYGTEDDDSDPWGWGG